MFGPKIKNVFKSRWNAVFWSLSVLLTAYCSVPSPHDGATSKKDQEAAERLMKRFVPHETAHHGHTNPWAKDTGDGAKPTHG
jgi:hypothetical protein